MASVHWGAAQWPFDENNEENIFCNTRKRECYTAYAKLAAHKIEEVWTPFKSGKLPAWLHLPPGYSSGKIPPVVTIPGMDPPKEVNVAMYGDRWLQRGMAVLAIDGPGQHESAVRGIPASTENWAAAGGAIMDRIEQRPEIDSGKVAASGSSFGSYFSTIMVPTSRASNAWWCRRRTSSPVATRSLRRPHRPSSSASCIRLGLPTKRNPRSSGLA